MSAAVQTCTARADGYVRREPEATVLYRVVREHWPRFLERAQEEGGLPRFVVRDFEEFLRCGVLEHGVVQLSCSRCGHSMVVAFSCKRRGWCPSCLGRRMADLAAHLVDEVLPEVPLRQWVCSLPWAMRCMLAFDRALCADVLAVFVAALTRSLKRRAKRHLSLRSVDDALVGALTVIQRSDSALRINPHFHTLALDGVLAAHSAVRAEIVPGREPPRPPAQLPLFEASDAPLEPPPPLSRHPWAWLLRRVFAVEVSICPVPTCGGRMRVVDIATTPDDVERVLGGKPTRARAPPPPSVSPVQLRLVFA